MKLVSNPIQNIKFGRWARSVFGVKSIANIDPVFVLLSNKITHALGSIYKYELDI